MGVLHGIRTFLPHIRAHGEGGHIVNTASMAGMQSGLGFSPYSASKFAVVTMSEGLAMQLKPLGIGVTRAVSRICPHPHQREWAQPAGALRAAPDAGPGEPGGALAARCRRARTVRARSHRMSPRMSSPRSARTNSTCSRIRADWRAELEERFAAILAAMDKAAAR